MKVTELTWGIGFTCLIVGIFVKYFNFTLSEALIYWGMIVLIGGFVQIIRDSD